MSQDILEVTLVSEQDTVRLGAALAKLLPVPAVVFLEGQLGAGKTALTRSVLRGTGFEGAVKSPTYTIVEPYQLPKATFYHFDLYRLADPEELELMGVRDYFDQDAVCFIEWPQRGQGLLPEPDLAIELSVEGEERRIVRLQAFSEAAHTVLVQLRKQW